jgi:hypothetical protein
MLNNQKEIADEFKLCYDKYIFEMEKKGGNLYKFNEATKLAGAGGTKGSTDVAVADKLIAKIDEIAVIFADSKK